MFLSASKVLHSQKSCLPYITIRYHNSAMNPCLYITTHQHDSSHPQQSQDSPHETGLGLTMEEMEEAALAGMTAVCASGVESRQ